MRDSPRGFHSTIDIQQSSVLVKTSPALLVLMACMLLGLLRPRWPWRWVVMVGTFIPLTELVAYLVLTVKPSRAQVYGSFLAFLPGIAGAYGGSLMRGVIENLRRGG